MELWIIFILLTIVVSVILSLLDYNLLQGVYGNAEIPSIISCSFFFPVCIYFFLSGIDFSSTSIVFLSIIAGLFTFWGSYAYSLSYAHKISPGTTLGIMKVQMIFAFLFWYFILQESLTYLQMVWHGIIFLWALWLSIEHIQFWWKRSHFVIPFLWAISYSISYILVDSLYKVSDFSTVFWLFCFGFFLWSPILILFTSNGKNFVKHFHKKWKVYLGLWIITEMFWIMEFLFWNLALKHGPLSLVIFLKETYVALLVIISLIFWYFYPRYFPDGWKKITFKKLWIIIFMLVWVYLALQ